MVSPIYTTTLIGPRSTVRARDSMSTDSAILELVEAVLVLKGRGWEPLWVPPRSKNPNRRNWQNERLEEDEIKTRFARGGNVGLITGEPSGGLTDVDLDAMEAIDCAGDYYRRRA